MSEELTKLKDDLQWARADVRDSLKIMCEYREALHQRKRALAQYFRDKGMLKEDFGEYRGKLLAVRSPREALLVVEDQLYFLVGTFYPLPSQLEEKVGQEVDFRVFCGGRVDVARLVDGWVVYEENGDGIPNQRLTSDMSELVPVVSCVANSLNEILL